MSDEHEQKCKPKPPKKTREEILEEAKKALAKSQSEDKLESDRISDLEKRAGEAQKIIDDYGKALGHLTKQQKDFAKYHADQDTMIEALYPNGSETEIAISSFIENYNIEIDKTKAKIEELQGKKNGDYDQRQTGNVEAEAAAALLKSGIPELEARLAKAQKRHEKAVGEFEALKGFQKAVVDGYKSLDALRTDIEKAEGDGETQLMYFLIKDLLHGALNTPIISEEIFPKYKTYKLNNLIPSADLPSLDMAKFVGDAWNLLDRTKTNVNLIKAVLEVKKGQLEDAQSKLQEQLSQRREEISKDIEEEFAPKDETAA